MGKKFILLFCILAATCITYSQNISIKGIVTDSITGEPLPYVAVLLKGTTIGGTTDLDGKFELSNVPPQGVLVVSYVGYQTQEISYSGNQPFRIVLKEDTEML